MYFGFAFDTTRCYIDGKMRYVVFLFRRWYLCMDSRLHRRSGLMSLRLHAVYFYSFTGNENLKEVGSSSYKAFSISLRVVDLGWL